VAGVVTVDADAVIVTGFTSAPLYTMPMSCEPDPTCTLDAAVAPLTESFTAPVVSLLVTVTGLANVPEIGACDELSTLKLNVPPAKLIGVPACGLFGSPLIARDVGTDADPDTGVGVGVGCDVGNDVGGVVAVGVVVGGIDAVPVGELTGDALLVGALDDVGVGPLDALDVGCPPGELLGATDGTTPPVYKTKYAVGGSERTGRFGCSVTAPPLDVAGPATVVHVLPCSCAR
jgi:hypothetical protein